ncbi:hypothetical protein CHU98_g5202 [Xylaria longipes]|nr:hypothetical protein CHU98_g5202 [Xylaria longipes]
MRGMYSAYQMKYTVSTLSRLQVGVGVQAHSIREPLSVSLRKGVTRPRPYLAACRLAPELRTGITPGNPHSTNVCLAALGDFKRDENSIGSRHPFGKSWRSSLRQHAHSSHTSTTVFRLISLKPLLILTVDLDLS